MGVYMRGMEMPKSCGECPFADVIHKWEAVESGVYCQGELRDEDPEKSEWRNKRYDDCPLIEIVTCGECKHRDPEDKKCDCGQMERQGCIFPVADDYFCKYGERRTDE